MSRVDELNELRCDSKWDAVAELAAEHHSEPIFVLAGIESKVVSAEFTGENVRPLLHEIPRVLSSKEDAFIAAALTGHILLLSGSAKKALAALDDTFNPPASSPYIGAVVVKSRALLGAVYSSLGETKRAVETMESVNISERTLSSNHEAAVWATRLYSQLYNLDPVEVHKTAYQNAVNLGNLHGDKRVPGLDTSPQPVPVNGTSNGTLNGTSQGTRAVESKAADADDTVVHHKLPGNSHSKDLHAVASGQSPLQSKLAKQKIIEADAEKTTDLWRDAVDLQKPLHLVVSKNQRVQTKELFAKVSAWIEQTFDSAVLMRINCELLLALGEYYEAFSAFNTYTEYQKLQLLKQLSGAHATPDDEVRCMQLHGSILSLITLGPLIYSVPRMERLSNILVRLEATKPSVNETAKGIYHGLSARIYVWQALESVGNDYFNNRLDLAEQHFDLCFNSPWAGDAQTHYLYALINIQKRPSADAFAHLKDSLAKFPDFLPLWQLLILLLTTEHQYEDAQKIAEQVLLENMTIDFDRVSPQVKRTIMEIKKTQVAIVEAQHGITVALDELGDVLELVSAIYPDRDILRPSAITGAVQAPAAEEHVETISTGKHHAHNRLNILRGVTGGRRKFKIPSSTQVKPARAKPSSPLDTEAKNHLVNIWLWVAQVYLRADMIEESNAAINEAETIGLGPTANTIAAKAQALVSTDPVKAWKKFDEALALDYDNISAVIGKANLLDVYGRTSNGIVDESKSSILFETGGNELEATRSSLSALESLVNRNPGRFISEAWCLYGIVLDNLGDKDAAKNALWKSVSLEEKSGVRAFIPNFVYNS